MAAIIYASYDGKNAKQVSIVKNVLGIAKAIPKTIYYNVIDFLKKLI